MPRISFEFSGDAFADGGGSDKFLMDVSEKLSDHYGRLVRQSNVFRIRSADIRLRNPNPNVGVQDQAMAVSGMLVYYEPTKNRKLAWRNAFHAWLANRKALGIKSRGADFRVGLSDGYSTDVGWGGDGVKYNAWINSDAQPLMLHSGQAIQSVFATWNNNVAGASNQPQNPDDGFGHWAQKDAASIGDELDFVTNEVPYYRDEEASDEAATLPFMVNFSAWFDDANSDPSDFGSATNADRTGPFTSMCGVVGVYVDTTTVDDTETQTQDWVLQVSLDVESWSPFFPRKKKSKKGAKK